MNTKEFKNPMTKFLQYEYALYMMVSDFFHKVHCDSLVLKTLDLYYKELVSENRETGKASYERQYRVEDKIQELINRDIADKVVFPSMETSDVELTILNEKNGLHSFIFSNGIFGFHIGLKLGSKIGMDGEERLFLKGIWFHNLSPFLGENEAKGKNSLILYLQYEYALYMMVSDFFHKVHCDSKVVNTLEQYYKELVIEDQETGECSYECQYKMEERIQKLINRDIAHKVVFPSMETCDVELTIHKEKNGLHSFIFKNGIYGFSTGLELGSKIGMDGEERLFLKGLRFHNLSPLVGDGNETNGKKSA